MEHHVPHIVGLVGAAAHPGVEFAHVFEFCVVARVPENFGGNLFLVSLKENVVGATGCLHRFLCDQLLFLLFDFVDLTKKLTLKQSLT